MADGWGDTADDGWGASSTTTAAAPSSGNNASSAWGSSSGGSSEWGSGSGRSSTGGGARNGSSTWGSKPGWAAGVASSSAPKERNQSGLRMQSMLTIEKMSVDTLATDIRSHFGRFGTITRLVLDYRFEEDRVNCWLDFEKQETCEVSYRPTDPIIHMYFPPDVDRHQNV